MTNPSRDHGVVTHGRGEYVSRQDRTIHTNTVEGFYSIFKRGMQGVYQHCSKKHLHRYVAEFDFRYSNRIATGVDAPHAPRARWRVWLASGSPIERLVEGGREPPRGRKRKGWRRRPTVTDKNQLALPFDNDNGRD